MKIALVGGGSSSIAVYIELIRKLHLSIDTITIYDSNGLLSSSAFSNQGDYFITNTSVGVTSVSTVDDMDLLNWLRSSCPELNATAESFIPRRLIGKYLKSRFETALDFAYSFACSTHIIKSTVVELKEIDNNRCMLVTDTGLMQEYDIVVLATGAAPLEPVKHLSKSTNYLPSPYPEIDLINSIKQAQNVLVIGSKLTAIDAVICILEHSSNTRITMMSPSGELPSVRSQLLVYKAGHFHSNSLLNNKLDTNMRKLFIAAAKDLRSLSRQYKVAKSTDADLHAYDVLLKDIKNCAEGYCSWQYAIGSFIDQANLIWPFLSLTDQCLLKNRYKRFISRYVSSIPIVNANKLYSGFQSGRLSIVSSISDQFLAENTKTGVNCLNILEGTCFDLIVNAAGLNVSGFQNTSLYRSLAQISPILNPHGGLCVSPNTMRLYLNKPETMVFAVGAPVSGALLVTNYLRASVKQAKNLVKHIEINQFKNSQCKMVA